MLNQIEKQFEGFIQAMYGNRTIGEEQEKDIEKTFFAGMLVCLEMFNSLDDDEEVAIAQLETLSKQIYAKAEEIVK